MKYYGTAGDLNNALKNGAWVYDPSTAHHPADSGEYGVCLVLNKGNASYTEYDWFFQLAFATNGHIYTRNSINATDASGWTSWVMVS